MFQHLWSVIHSTVKWNKARYLYGIIYSVGGLGAMLGSLVDGFFATYLGSEALLCFSVVSYSVFILSYKSMLRSREQIEEQGADLGSIKLKKSSPKGGFKLIQGSKFLLFVLLIVVFMQMTASLIDFQFNAILEKKISLKDLRTAYYGKFFSMVHGANIFFQVAGAFLLVKALGIRRSHFLIPLLFCSGIVSFIFFPSFAIISLSFGMIKSFDYSIFSLIKEMLYIPLKPEEKFKAKAVIDVFAYRGSKTLSALIILSLQTLSYSLIVSTVSWILLGIFALWLISIFMLFKQRDSAAFEV